MPSAFKYGNCSIVNEVIVEGNPSFVTGAPLAKEIEDIEEFFASTVVRRD